MLSGGVSVDIHKPKPVHGWREFLSEIGVIVVGVLIALAAEQAVEWLHWRHVVEVERSALLSEVRGNLGVVQTRLNLQPCIQRRLDELQVVFARHGNGQALGLKSAVGIPIPEASSKDTWNIAVSGQGLTHVPYDEQLELRRHPA